MPGKHLPVPGNVSDGEDVEPGMAVPRPKAPGPRRRRTAVVVTVAAIGAVLVVTALVVVFTRGGGSASKEGPKAVSGTPACSATTGSAPASSASASGSASASASAPGASGAAQGVDVRTFGASGDGVTDDAPAIRRALASADAVHIPAGTYLLGSYATPRTTLIDADFVFSLRDGQTITADPGAVFKMADGSITGSSAAWGGNVFLADKVHDVTISGLTLDLNGPHNLVPAGRTITGYGLYTYAGQHIRLTGVTMLDTPGQNYVVAQAGGDDIRVEKSTFRNGGTSVPGNTHQTDFSALYFTATDVVVDGITITHDHAPFNYSGGVELHGSHQSVTHSRIEKSWPAVYIGPDANTGGPTQQDVTVACNTFLDVGRGVVFNADGTKNIDQVQLVRNDITLRKYDAFRSEPTRGIDQDKPTGRNWTYHHIITGLTVGQNRIEDADGSADAAVRLSQVQSATIVDNDLRNIAGSALDLEGSPWGTKNVDFERNSVDWLGSTPAQAVTLSLGGSSTKPAVPAFTAENITVAHNRITLLRPDGNRCAVYADWNADAGVTGIRLYSNELSGISTDTCGPQAARLQTTP